MSILAVDEAPVTDAERGRPALLAELERIKMLVAAHLDGAAIEPLPTPCAADVIAQRLGLSPFERDVLILTAAVELDSEAAELVAQVAGEVRPTFALALAALPGAHWDALLPDRPLRRWLLVDTVGTGPLVTRSLVLDEHVLHYLTGLVDLSTTLGGLASPPLDLPALTPRQATDADELAGAAAALDGPVLIRVDGDDVDARLGVAASVAERLGMTLLRVRDAALDETETMRTATLLDREALLCDRMVLTGNTRLLELLRSQYVATAAADIDDAGERTLLARTVHLPDGPEQAALWRRAVGAKCEQDTSVGRATGDLARHYRLAARGIAAVAGEWVATTDGTADELRRLARERARVGLGELADRIEPRAGWDDLVVPAGLKGLLHDLTRQVSHRSTVYDEWGFAARSNRGLGISALFAGESGTGKTMAAEVIAGELSLDLYRIELSAVVSKYIGETEKNLRRVFDAAESGGAVLLFDEADALFGRRGEVKDSHDRYANLEVAYLLQRMESYRGLAILTTNLRSNVDRAFLRRLRFVVQFPLPDQTLRSEIWRRAFPAQTPTEGLDPEALAHLQIPGGSIHAIAVSAAFAAADEGAPVSLRHVLHAAKVEYAKSERLLTDTELRAVTAAAR